MPPLASPDETQESRLWANHEIQNRKPWFSPWLGLYAISFNRYSSTWNDCDRYGIVAYRLLTVGSTFDTSGCAASTSGRISFLSACVPSVANGSSTCRVAGSRLTAGVSALSVGESWAANGSRWISVERVTASV